jgi:hypothetical protein
MTTINEAVAAAVHQCNSLAAQVRKLTAGQDKIDTILRLLIGHEPTLSQVIVAKAAKVIPFVYNMQIVLPAAAGAVTGQVVINQDGYFLLDRIRCAYRPTAGGAGIANRWQPFSGNADAVVLGEAFLGVPIPQVIDFEFDITEGSAQRRRNMNPIPGDLLTRNDGDGILYDTPDVFPPASTVGITVFPLAAPANAGVLVFSLWGRHALNVIEG